MSPRYRPRPSAELPGIGHEPLFLLAQAFDREPHPVAWSQEFRWLEAHPDPRRGTGRDHVARHQGQELADIADDLVDPEDQVAGVAALPPLAVDLGPQRELSRVADLVGCDQPGADRAEGVGALTLGPLSAALDLEFALTDVVDDAIAGDMPARLGLRDITGEAADDDAELDLVVGLLRALRDDHIVVGAADRRGCFHKEDRLFRDRLPRLLRV